MTDQYFIYGEVFFKTKTLKQDTQHQSTERVFNGEMGIIIEHHCITDYVIDSMDSISNIELIMSGDIPIVKLLLSRFEVTHRSLFSVLIHRLGDSKSDVLDNMNKLIYETKTLSVVFRIKNISKL